MTQKVKISPEVEMAAMRDENAWLRNRALILGQALQEALAELKEVQTKLAWAQAQPEQAEDPAHG